jgi:hypothetical protein
MVAGCSERASEGHEYVLQALNCVRTNIIKRTPATTCDDLPLRPMPLAWTGPHAFRLGQFEA